MTAKNGFEAVAAVHKATADDESFNVILMDISMPGMDGFEATKVIQAFEIAARNEEPGGTEPHGPDHTQAVKESVTTRVGG